MPGRRQSGRATRPSRRGLRLASTAPKLSDHARRLPRPVRLATDELSLAGDAYGSPDDPPVVLFHGGGQTRHSWRHTAEQLGGSGWYAVSVDLRGHGESDWSPDRTYTIDGFAADTRAVACSFAEPPALVGDPQRGV